MAVKQALVVYKGKPALAEEKGAAWSSRWKEAQG